MVYYKVLSAITSKVIYFRDVILLYISAVVMQLLPEGMDIETANQFSVLVLHIIQTLGGLAILIYTVQKIIFFKKKNKGVKNG